MAPPTSFLCIAILIFIGLTQLKALNKDSGVRYTIKHVFEWYNDFAVHQGGISEGHLKNFPTWKFEFFTYFLYFWEICLNLDIYDFLIVLVWFSAFYRDLKQVCSFILSRFMIIFPRTIEIFEKFHEFFSGKICIFSNGRYFPKFLYFYLKFSVGDPYY